MTIYEALGITSPTFDQATRPRPKWPADFTLDESVIVSCALQDFLDQAIEKMDAGSKGWGERVFLTRSALVKVRGF